MTMRPLGHRTDVEANEHWAVHKDPCGQVWSQYGLVAVVHTGDESDPRINGGLKPHPNNPHTKDAWLKVQANARLIAAAPDLLEAAKDFVAKVDAGLAHSTDSYNKFKTAIAKAEGQP